MSPSSPSRFLIGICRYAFCCLSLYLFLSLELKGEKKRIRDKNQIRVDRVNLLVDWKLKTMKVEIGKAIYSMVLSMVQKVTMHY